MGRKRVFIIHGWGGYPEEGWFPWLKKELERREFEVQVPQMPDTDNPRIQKWIPAIQEIVSSPDKDTYFVGHSMGNPAIARYLEGLSEDIKVGGVVFVAGFFKRLTGLEDNLEEKATDSHWFEAPLDFAKVKSHMKNSTAIFSDNDVFVPFDNQDVFRNKLGSKIIIEHNKGHFSESDNVKELPVVLDELLKMAK